MQRGVATAGQAAADSSTTGVYPDASPRIEQLRPPSTPVGTSPATVTRCKPARLIVVVVEGLLLGDPVVEQGKYRIHRE